MRRYAFLKPLSDAHTLGINAIQSALISSDQSLISLDLSLSETNDQGKLLHKEALLKTLVDQKISHFGFSYRLDEKNALNLVDDFEKSRQEHSELRTLKLYFAGLPKSCESISKKYPSITSFKGSEVLMDVLRALDVEEDKIPQSYLKGSLYDEHLMKLAKDFMESKTEFIYPAKVLYPEFGTHQDRLYLRLRAQQSISDLPLTRVHVGPYDLDKEKALSLYEEWVKTLAKTHKLDILSIGSSQLTQSHFNEDWTGLANGGGIPIQTEQDYIRIYKASRPLLVRTYSGTKKVDELAPIHERSINIAWHALSLWWFNQLDGRGPNGVLENLEEHIRTLRYIAQTHKPFEANTPHHFSFRGADDVTYILSAVLAARLAKKEGIEEYVLQVMLNTPRYTWGIVDIAKVRAILDLIEKLKDERFKVYLQPRAGLDFFAPDLEKAKIQLSMVSMLMDDLEPNNPVSPPIVHVVSYSEAMYLANPHIINESLDITLASIDHYRRLKAQGNTLLKSAEDQIEAKKTFFVQETQILLKAIEENIPDYLSAQGLYSIFTQGYLSTPSLWNSSQAYPNATHFKSSFFEGSTILIDDAGKHIDAKTKVAWILNPTKDE